MMALDWLNPFRYTVRPALAGCALGLLALGGGHYLLPLAVVPGVIFCVIGGRIAIDRRIAYGNIGTDGYSDDEVVYRVVIPWRDRRRSLSVSRQTAAGAVIIFGVFFLCLAAAGFAAI
jgi:hypothetical protein